MTNKTNEAQHPPMTDDDWLEYALYHVLVVRIESYFRLDPCPAIKASNELTYGLMQQVRAYLAWHESEEQNEASL